MDREYGRYSEDEELDKKFEYEEQKYLSEADLEKAEEELYDVLLAELGYYYED